MDSNVINIKSIDLSHFNSSLIKSMNNTFSGCSELIALDMSNMDLENLNSTDNIFESFENLKYIDLKNTILNNNTIITFSGELKNKTKLIPCHNNADLEVPSVCCDFDIELGRCQQTNNYIVLVLTYSSEHLMRLFPGKTKGYKNGFMNNKDERKSISFVNYKNSTYRYDSPFYFDLKDYQTEIEIHFFKPITNLSYFFSSNGLNSEPIYSIDFSHFDSSLIEDTSCMFENNKYIEEINFTNFNTSLVKNMENMFKDCSNLASLDLTIFDTSSVTSMASMFKGCSNLKFLDLSNFNTSSVTSMASMFFSCSYLIVLDISNFVMNKRTNYTDMFGYLPNLKYISLKNINIDVEPNETFSSLKWEDERKELLVCQKDTYISNATEFCCEKNNNSLFCKTDNYITVKYKEDSDYSCGFIVDKKCKSSMSIRSLAALYQNYARKAISFINIRNTSYISCYSPLKIKKNDIIEIHFTSPPQSLENFFSVGVQIPFAPGMSMPSIFIADKNIISVDFSHFNSSLVKNMKSLFSSSSIEEINFSNFVTSGVTDMSSMFEGCTSLKSLNLSNFNTSKVGDMSNMFYGCTSLKSLNLSNFNTSKVGDMSYMFSGCESLQYLDISHFSTNSLGSQANFNGTFALIENSLYLNLYNIEDENSYITQEIINENKTNFIICSKGNENENLTNICKDNYYQYPAINYVTITYKGENNNNKRELKIDSGYFQISSGKTVEIHFSSLLTKFGNLFSCNSIGSQEVKEKYDFSHFDSSNVINMNSMFDNCDTIEYINFTNFKTSSVTDMSNMFKGCKSLKSLNLESFDTSSVTDMSNMFSGCNSLEYIDISNMTENEMIKKELSSLNSNENLKRCQTNDIIQDVNTACCDSYS